MNAGLKKDKLAKLNVIYSIILFVFMGLPKTIIAQTSYTDSLKNLLLTLQDDTIKIDVNQQLMMFHLTSFPDSAIRFANEGLKLAYKLNLQRKQIDLHVPMSIALGEKFFIRT